MKNFRRIISVLCAAAMLLSLCACSKREKYDAVFITDVGDIYDRSYNSAVWDGVRSYAADYGVNCKYYRPSQRGTKYFSKAIKKAINHGARAIVCHGDEFCDAVIKAAERWDDVKFIIIDCKEKNLPSNVLAVGYSTLDAGYLAGYASVSNGFSASDFKAAAHLMIMSITASASFRCRARRRRFDARSYVGRDKSEFPQDRRE